MEPKLHRKRTPVPGAGQVDVMDIDKTLIADDEFLEADEGFLDDMPSDAEAQSIRIDSLKRAIDIAKLMSNVDVDDVINIAKLVIKFINETEI